MIEVLDITQDIFLLYPELALILPNISSEEAWAIVLYSDPKSLLYRQDHKSKTELIKEQYYKDFDPVKSLPLIEAYTKAALPKHARLLTSWETKLEQIDEFISSIKPDQDTTEYLIKIMEKTPALWKRYKEIQKIFEDAEETVSMGNQEESLSEQGII